MKRIIILIGPKGVGKSTIGHLLATQLGVHFLRVEPLFLQVRAALGSAHPDFEIRGLESVLTNLREALSNYETVCIESTGASRHLEWFLTEVSQIAQVYLVRVIALPQQCLERIRTRNTTIHIPVSDDQIEHINAIAAQVYLPWVAQIDNRGSFNAENICRIVSSLLANGPSSPNMAGA